LSQPQGLAERLERWGTLLENLALVLLLSALILVAVGQIVARIGFSTGFIWADELVRLLVMWIALVASIAASRSNRHLRIDVLSHFVAAKYARIPRIIVDAFASFICAVLAWQSWRYLQVVREFEDTVLVDVPAWMAYLLLPIAFALMSYRFALSSGGNALRAVGGQEAEATTP